ncbi:hypothetical protein OEZ85_012814 [Tetradesmus obliquus]|uniref:Uncharacterized protein n=1 Tax=Tetradesmus obliquus TaxID=3088 RepID=A0ABY8U3Q6_TETOB|nr:hypothetical protein OEZ85_012814 [Tetradesmus obliquus]
MPPDSIWSEIQSRVKNNKEKQLVNELQALVGRLEACLQQLQQSRALATQYEGVWCSLLACRRADLMPAVPLAGERLAQVQAAAGACAACAQQLLPALQSGAGMLAAFATVNRATAEELGQTEALQLVSMQSDSTQSSRVW